METRNEKAQDFRTHLPGRRNPGRRRRLPYGDWTAPYRTPAGGDLIGWGPVEDRGADIIEGVHGVKSKDGPDLIVWGSSTLTSTLLEHGLADEVLLIVYPVVLGPGKRFFAEGTPPRSFELASTQALPSGIVVNAYNVAGPLKNQGQ